MSILSCALLPGILPDDIRLAEHARRLQPRKSPSISGELLYCLRSREIASPRACDGPRLDGSRQLRQETTSCGYDVVAACQLPKLNARVRFPLPAPNHPEYGLDRHILRHPADSLPYPELSEISTSTGLTCRTYFECAYIEQENGRNLLDIPDSFLFLTCKFEFSDSPVSASCEIPIWFPHEEQMPEQYNSIQREQPCFRQITIYRDNEYGSHR